MLNTGRFSLYSTDTEEQVVSMSRGLDRCAALLKSLLSPEKQAAAGQPQPTQVHAGRGKLSDKLTKKPTAEVDRRSGKSSSSSTEGRARQPRSAEPSFPGATKHVGTVHHPHACSTPRKNHLRPGHFRSATEPKPVGDLQDRNVEVEKHSSEHGVCNHIEVEARGRRKHLRAQRRLNSEAKHKRSRSADARKEQGHRHGNEPSSTAPRFPSRQLDACCPAVTDCYLCPYHHHIHSCYAPPTSQYAPAVPIPPSYACPHCAPLWAWPLGGDCPGNIGKTERCNSAPGARPKCPSDNTAPPSHAAGSMDVRVSGGSAVASSSIHSIQSLTQEMSTALGHGLDSLKKLVEKKDGSGNGAVHQLETVEYSLKLYCSQLSLQCQKLLLTSCRSDRPSPPPSPPPSQLAQWQSQLKQLEEEKSRLLERLISSETAYSEVKGQLDQATEKQAAFRRELEAGGAQIVALRKEVEQSSRLLSQLRLQKTTTERELRDTQSAAEDRLKQTKAESEDLRRQVDILTKELVKLKEDHLKDVGRLSKTQASLDRAQDDVQLMKLTLSEKETQLLHSQDQQLGLRQCLAYFLSDLRLHDHTSSSSHPGGSYYTVPCKVVRNFQSLVNDGAINEFLAHYTEREDRYQETDRSLSLQDTTNQSQDFEQLSPGCVSEASSVVCVASGQLTKVGRHSNSDSNGVERESSRHDTLMEEKLVEGSSVKSQSRPHPRQSHDLTAVGRGDRNSTYPESCVELKGQSPSRSTLSSLQTNVTGTSCRTTASEAEFRSDLANLDADIARLQMQFRVAMVTPLP